MSFASDASCWRDVYIAAAARGLSVCGDFLAATALALALQQAGAGGFLVSALMLAAIAPIALLAPIGGRLADRADSRAILVTVGSAQSVICSVLAFVSEPWLIIALVAVLASGLAVTQPTLAALVPAMVRREDMSRAGGITQTASSVGMLVAPALAGVLAGQFGARVPLLIDAVSYAALVAAGVLLRTRRGSAQRATGSWTLRSDRLVAVMIVALAVTVAGVGAINVIEVFFIRETLHASTTIFGLVSAAWTAGVLLGAPIFGRLGRRWNDPAKLVRMVLLCAAGCCVVVLGAATVPNAWLIVPFWIVGGFCNGGLNVYSAVVIAERVPDAVRGRAFAAMSAAVQAGGMVGFLVGGPLLELFAPRPLVAAAGLAGLVAVAICFAPVREFAPSGPASAKVGDSVGA
ncbi:MFS transporter [Actinoplanes sp. TFC3]|uniref:MFS transporter n=1 Tax=Actinoplanes sp. TFC3 TaxID=1710355 RepID=UPI0008368019|nr:MFS transporter [Actinoplanes sp. TFC3]